MKLKTKFGDIITDIISGKCNLIISAGGVFYRCGPSSYSSILLESYIGCKNISYLHERIFGASSSDRIEWLDNHIGYKNV